MNRRLTGDSLEPRRMLAGDPVFASPVEYRVGDNPEHVTAADVNADGILDIVTANYFSKDISILIGNGDGTFQRESIQRAGFGAVNVAVDDFNDDGVPDLAVANLEGNDVSVMLGMGDGTFRRRVQYATGVYPESVAAGDLDDDGNVDLILPHTGSPLDPGGVSILFGTGDGEFAQVFETAEELRPTSVKVADLNADGNLDLVLANGFPFVAGNDDVAILLGHGDGGFDEADRYFILDGELPNDIAVADFNNDQVLDVASVNTLSETIAVLLGVGDGTLAEAAIYDLPGVGPYASIASGDIDGDGAIDLVAALSDSVATLVNQGDGTFGDPFVLPDLGGPAWVTLGDFNQDQRFDLAAVFQGPLPQDGIVSVSLSSAPGDVNLDGTLSAGDIDFLYNAISDKSSDRSFDLNEDGAVTTEDVTYLVEELFSTTFGDANLDGAVDFADFQLLSVNYGKSDLSWMQGDFDGDGNVTFGDFQLLSVHFGFTRDR